MLSKTFWDKQHLRSYEGSIHIGPTSATHCTSCDGGKRPLARGIAVHFTDQAGLPVFTTGPECFKKHTDIESLGQIPTIGYGFGDVTLGRTPAGTTRLYAGFKAAANESITPRQQNAYGNVLLRAKILPAMGFAINQAGLQKYLSAPFPFEEKTLLNIEHYVDVGMAKHRQPSLDQLCRAEYVAHQIDALKRKKLHPKEVAFVKSLEGTLKVYFGLTNRQMEALEKASARHGLHLQETGIRFPENQARFEQSKRFD